MQSRCDGFSLVELMVAVVIIGVLMSVAVPVYQDQVARAQLSAALAEVVPARSAYEVLLQQDQGYVPADVEEIGLQASSPRCSAYAVLAGSISCTLRGNDSVQGARLTLSRDPGNGQWTCSVSGAAVKPRHVPGGCVLDANTV